MLLAKEVLESLRNSLISPGGTIFSKPTELYNETSKNILQINLALIKLGHIERSLD